MRHKISLSTMFVALGLAFSASTAMAADEKAAAGGDTMSRASVLSYTCAGCHGTNGVSVGPAIPTIAGMAEDTFTDAMLAYKDKEGGKNATIMSRLAAGYTEEDITAMAGFFAKQEFVAAKQDFDTAKAEAGKKIHEKQCEKCHEEGGSVDVDGSGRLAGQWKPYLQYSMADAVSGERDYGKKMSKKVKSMHEADGDDGVAALVEFYASQQ